MQSMLELKRTAVPVWYSGTPMVLAPQRRLFPYLNNWHGNYLDPDARVDRRDAGYVPRLDLQPVKPPAYTYGFKHSCFDYPPFTQYPCFEETPNGCKRSMHCVSRVDAR